MSMITSGIGAAIDWGVDAIVGDPNDALRPVQNFRPSRFSTRGLTGSFNRGTNTFNLTPTSATTNAVTGVQDALTGRADELRGLIPLSSQGFGRLTEAGLNRIGDQRRRAIGNLRENLARRRLSGSSFAADAVSRAEAEFAREEADFEARTSLQEIDMATRLVDAATQSEIASAQTALEQLNFESQLGAQLSSEMNSILSGNAQLQSQILTEYAGARANIIGSIAGAFTTGMVAASDVRLKKDIKQVGSLKDLAVYAFTYLWGERAIGVMAHEVEKVLPGAVIELCGLKFVNYQMVENYGTQ